MAKMRNFSLSNFI